MFYIYWVLMTGFSVLATVAISMRFEKRQKMASNQTPASNPSAKY